jgi:hypothetical protein
MGTAMMAVDCHVPCQQQELNTWNSYVYPVRSHDAEHQQASKGSHLKSTAMNPTK